MPVADPVNILLVDDQPAKLLTYEAMLDQLGLNLIKASSGREALEHLLRQEITLVLMDVSMPDLDGFELAEIIREHPRFRKTAIIFVSAVHLTDMDRLKGYASGAVDYVAVPVQPELLRAKVSVFTELRRKTLEAEQLARELERRVSERTAELEASTRQLAQLADELRAADHRKDEFLALLAHELRNPLAPVLNAVSIMRARGIDDPDLVWCRDIIERQAHQLTRLVDDLLDCVAHQPRQGPAPIRAGRALGHHPGRCRDLPAARRRTAARAAHQPAAAAGPRCMAIPPASSRYWRTSSTMRPSIRRRAGGSTSRSPPRMVPPRSS
jgi:CheY-like chemotaxis protein